jgi:hypothetical protein
MIMIHYIELLANGEYHGINIAENNSMAGK